jgi:hypothetical protein
LRPADPYLLNIHHIYISHSIFFYRINKDVVKEEPVSDEEMSPVLCVNGAIDMKYEDCDVPIPFPVVVIEDKVSLIVCNDSHLFCTE